MRPNFLHSSSSSISWQQQQRNNNGIPALFPYNQQQLSDEGTSFHRPQLELMNMESLSSLSTTTRLVNYNEEDEIGDHVVVLGRALDAAAEEGGGGQLQTAAPAAPLEKEHMFDKVVTPSDVGKLNRLVIPKQHAEKYFPLDSSTNEKGLLLNFEDRNGKPWRFRYSYWNSSQSYVMTKGWSRFVKDKKLDAGDIVSFSRGVGELGKDRLFIDWRRRPTAPPPLLPPPQPSPGHQYYSFHPWNHPYFLQQQRCRDHHPSSSQQHPHHQINYNPHHQSSTTSSYGGGYGGGGGLMNGNPLIYFRSPIPQQQQMMMVPNNSGAGICSMMQMQRAGGAVAIDEDIIHDPMVFESVPVVQGKAAAKRLRLFGVNMDCPISDGDASISGDDVETDIILSSTAVHHHDHPPANPSPSPRNFYSSSSSSSSSMRAHPYNVGGPVQQRKMYSDNNKGKGSLSLDFDV